MAEIFRLIPPLRVVKGKEKQEQLPTYFKNLGGTIVFDQFSISLKTTEAAMAHLLRAKAADEYSK